MQRLGLVVLGVGLLAWVGWRLVLPRLWSRAASVAVVLDGEPEQTPVEGAEPLTVTRDGRRYVVEKLFKYEVSGEVLSASSYDVTWTNDFADVDLALLWGPRRAALKERFKFFQMGRWLFWRTEAPVTEEDKQEVTRHIGNHHLIPAEDSKHLGRAFRWLSKGDEVRLSGWLVRVVGPDGQALATSSTSRDDTGDGACEVVWVDELQVGSRVFR